MDEHPVSYVVIECKMMMPDWEKLTQIMYGLELAEGHIEGT